MSDYEPENLYFKNLLKSEKGPTYLRRIFLNLLVAFFIINVYIYFSSVLGSVSSSFINNMDFSINFSLTLLLFVFLSVLAGPIQGFISGFFGEFLFQLAYYSQLHIEWCFIIGIIGLFSGIYRYKPLKYQEGIKIYYTFLVLLISTLLIAILIILLQLIFSPSLPFESLVLNFGFEFFINALLSYVFIVPFLVFLYDFLLAKKERYIYRILLTHHPLNACDHSYYFKFGRTYVYFCTRCSGVIIGGIFSISVVDLTQRIFGVALSPEIAILMCIILPIPGIIDWGTQRLLLRKSTTESRLFTGFIIGVALQFIAYTEQYYFFTIILVIFYFSIVGIALFIGQKRELKRFQEQENQIPSLDGNNNEFE